jgi:hypothetical protein
MNSKLSKQEIKEKEIFFNYSYGNYFSNGVLVLTSTLLIAGLFLLNKGINDLSILVLPGLIMTLSGISSFFPIELFQINYQTREYRIAFKLGSYMSGEWRKIGEVQYLSIVNTSKKIYLSDNSDTSLPDTIKECRLRLYKKAGHTIDIDDYNTKESALIIGKIIAEGLDLKLLDASERPPVFIAL